MTLEALFADDCAHMALKEPDLQLIKNSAKASRLFGLTISLGKTESPVQSAPASTSLPLVSIKGTNLQSVEDFKYPSSVIFSDGTLN